MCIACVLMHARQACAIIIYQSVDQQPVDLVSCSVAGRADGACVGRPPIAYSAILDTSYTDVSR